MTHYFFDPKTNTLHGPLDRMPPVWDYGFPPDGPSDSQLASAEADYDDAWKAFNTYLQTLTSHPHAFTGESRVVPEGEIEWKMKCDAVSDCDCKLVCSFHSHSARRVATPINQEGKRDGIDNRIADEQSMAYVRCVFCDEECKPAPTNRGWSRIRYDQGLHFDCAEKVASQGRRLESEPLTAQPDRPNRYEYGNISEYLECYGDYVLRGTWNLPADFIAVNPPPTLTPGQGEKPDPMDYFLKPDQFDFDRFNKDMREYNNSRPAQQPHSPALQGEIVDALIYTITEANANGDQYGEIKSKVATLLSPAPPLTTDEEAAEKYMMTNIHAPLSKAFLAGCTHVRSQQTNLKTDKP